MRTKRRSDMLSLYSAERGVATFAERQSRGGGVQMRPTTSPSASVRAGKLRALAVTTATRSEALRDLPTVSEFVPGYEASGWYGIGAPKGTPVEIVEKLNKEINAFLELTCAAHSPMF